MNRYFIKSYYRIPPYDSDILMRELNKGVVTIGKIRSIKQQEAVLLSLPPYLPHLSPLLCCRGVRHGPFLPVLLERHLGPQNLLQCPEPRPAAGGLRHGPEERPGLLDRDEQVTSPHFSRCAISCNKYCCLYCIVGEPLGGKGDMCAC